MKNNVIKMMDNNEAQVSKTFAKNAKIYGTEEYRMWREFKAENPEYVMVVKTIKKNPDKKTTKNLKYENMRQFIKDQDNAEELLKEFEKEVRMSKIQSNPYRAVLAWFLQKFEGYDSYKKYFKELEEKNKKNNEENNNKNDEETTNVNIENMPSVANM